MERFEGAPVIAPGHRSPAWALWVGLVEPRVSWTLLPVRRYPTVNIPVLGGSDHHETSMKLTGFTILRFGPLAACLGLWPLASVWTLVFLGGLVRQVDFFGKLAKAS